MAVVTDGSKETWDRNLSPADLALTRTSEQRTAAQVFGADKVVFGNHPDGMLVSPLEHRAEMCELIRRVRR